MSIIIRSWKFIKHNKDPLLVILTLIIAIGGIWTSYESRQMANEERKKTDVELSPILFMDCKWYNSTFSKDEKQPEHAYAFSLGTIPFPTKKHPIHIISIIPASKNGYIVELPKISEHYFLTNYGRSPAFNIFIPCKYLAGTSFTELWKGNPRFGSGTAYIPIPPLSPGMTYDFIIINDTSFYYEYKCLDTVSMTTLFQKNFQQRLYLGNRCIPSNPIDLLPMSIIPVVPQRTVKRRNGRANRIP